MTIAITHPLYVAAIMSTKHAPLNQWSPISTQAYPVQGVAEREAKKMARHAKPHEQVGVIEYTAEGAKLVGPIHYGPTP